MELYFPVKNPINQNNLFGANPAEYKPLGQNGHPGNDFEAPIGTPIYSPCDGDAFYTFDSLGGDGIWIRVPNNSSPAFNIILWHMPPKGSTVKLADGSTDDAFKIPTGQSVVTSVKAGQLLGYSGNSGFPKESTGPHLHLGVLPCDSTGAPLHPDNGFLGCVDPRPFFNGKFAQDITIEEQIVSKAAQVVSVIQSAPVDNPTKLFWLEKVEAFLQELQKV